MNWATRRRFTILLILGAVASVFLTVMLIAIFYKTPTCADGVQNQGETGVDCGGPCDTLCPERVQSPTVLFTTALSKPDGRTDVAAIVENKNTDAVAKNVSYRIVLYDAERIFLKEVIGTVDLPPGTSVPVYVPNVETGRQKVAAAFLEIDEQSLRWVEAHRDARVLPVVSKTTLGGTDILPRIEAILQNSSPTVFLRIRVVVFVANPTGDIIAASQTIVPVIPAHGSASAVFTWNEPFSATPAVIRVMPQIPLL